MRRLKVKETPRRERQPHTDRQTASRTSQRQKIENDQRNIETERRARQSETNHEFIEEARLGTVEQKLQVNEVRGQHVRINHSTKLMDKVMKRSDKNGKTRNKKEEERKEKDKKSMAGVQG